MDTFASNLVGFLRRWDTDSLVVVVHPGRDVTRAHALISSEFPESVFTTNFWAAGDREIRVRSTKESPGDLSGYTLFLCNGGQSFPSEAQRCLQEWETRAL